MNDATARTLPRTLPFRELLDQAMVLTRRELRRLYLPFALMLALASGLQAVVQTFLFLPATTGGGTPDLGMLGLFYPVVFLVFAFIMLLFVAMVATAIDVLEGRPTSPGAALRAQLKIDVIATVVLYGVLVFVSYICCLFPVLYVAPLLSLTMPAMVAEGGRGMTPIRRSAELIRYNPRRRFLSNPLTKAFALFVVTFLIYLLISLVTQLPFQLPFQLATLRDAGLDSGGVAPWKMWLLVPGAVAGGFAQALVMLYSAFALGLLFFDSRERKEGHSLERELTALEDERAAAAEGASPGEEDVWP